MEDESLNPGRPLATTTSGKWVASSLLLHVLELFLAQLCPHSESAGTDAVGCRRATDAARPTSSRSSNSHRARATARNPAHPQSVVAHQWTPPRGCSGHQAFRAPPASHARRASRAPPTCPCRRRKSPLACPPSDPRPPASVCAAEPPTRPSAPPQAPEHPRPPVKAWAFPRDPPRRRTKMSSRSQQLGARPRVRHDRGSSAPPYPQSAQT